jgi:hypothetical protein
MDQSSPNHVLFIFHHYHFVLHFSLQVTNVQSKVAERACHKCKLAASSPSEHVADHIRPIETKVLLLCVHMNEFHNDYINYESLVCLFGGMGGYKLLYLTRESLGLQ